MAVVACECAYLLRKQYEPEDFEVFGHLLSAYVDNWASYDTLCNHTIDTFVMQYHPASRPGRYGTKRLRLDAESGKRGISGKGLRVCRPPQGHHATNSPALCHRENACRYACGSHEKVTGKTVGNVPFFQVTSRL